MKHTLDSYIKNPLGKGSSVFTQKDMYMKIYSEKLDLILLRENGKVDYKLIKQKDKYYIYLKIYSEVVKGFTYDTVLEFRPSNPITSHASKSLDSYNVRFFSNDGSFIFTFLYAFNKNDLFIKELSDKVPKECLKDKPKIRNPKAEIGYVKSLYFAYILIKRYKLLDKSKFKEATKTEIETIKKGIEKASIKIDRRNELGRTSAVISKAPDKKDQSHPTKQANKSTTVATTQTTKKTAVSKRSKIIKPK